MTALQAAILGIVQGLTEFLPISSSGHLIIFPEVLGWEEQGMAFDITVHFATLIAVCIALRKEIVMLFGGLVAGKAEAKSLAAKITVGTVPAILVGATMGDVLDSARNITIIALMLMVWGALLALADLMSRKERKAVTTAVTWPQAIVIGVAQAFALVPGTSRSGATMTAGLFAGLDRGAAARFSFLLSIPAILAAGTKTAWDTLQSGMTVEWDMLGIGFLAATISGIFAIRFLFYIINRTGFLPFAIYRIVLGAGLLYLVVSGFFIAT